MKKGRREFVQGITLSAATALSRRVPAATRKQPNIVFILADDMGYADLGCFGSRHIKTPVLDRLAARGVRMTDAYANSPVCSPTRLALVTGRYHTRFRTGLVEPFSAGPWGAKAIPTGQPTMPELLRKAGYFTALVGKWHLGETPEGGPLASGYDHYFGFLGGGIDYFTHEYMNRPALRSGDNATTREGYVTTLLADEAIQVIRQGVEKRQPFALSLHLNAPHWPWEGPEDKGLGTQGAHYDGGSLKTYANMTESLDREIGRVLAELDRRGVDRDTLVVFTSDNGGERFSETWPFRGAKGFLLEGGIRVPAIVRYPAALPAGRTSAQTSLTLDWMPTFLEAAGVGRSDQPELDGKSLLPNLASGNVEERSLFWRFQGHRQRAARRGRWKYYRAQDSEFLYDLESDSMERANRSRAEPAVFSSLKQAWEKWNTDMYVDDQQPGYCDRPADIGVPFDMSPDSGCRQPRPNPAGRPPTGGGQ
jgi:arylsulfatase A-like enzyme